MTRKKLLSLLIFLLLVSTALSVNMVRVSAVQLASPYIAVVPEKTVDPTITVGMNYTISIDTDYTGNDTYGWELSLTFNPCVLEGIEVRNGDLISPEKNSNATFVPGLGFDNTKGELGLTAAYFFSIGAPPFTTSGPGTLAYVTFRVVDKGISNITLRDAALRGYSGGKYYYIIDASEPPGRTAPPYGSDHIGHGYFDNLPPIHDVAVIINYTISIYTDYNGSDVWSWQFNLTFNPSVLKGVEVRNGDLITTAKSSTARFYPGKFNNTQGTLSLTSAKFSYTYPQTPYVTSGPGTLAYVTFNVVGTGDSNTTLGSAAQLLGAKGTTTYNITDAKLLVNPATVALGDIVSIDVAVANRGNYTETFNVTAYVNTTLIGTQTVTNLTRGNRETLTFTWNTTGIAVGNYIINATAELPDDNYPSDNTIATPPIKIKTGHDVAIVSLEIPAKPHEGELAPVNVTVANQGNFEENINLTVTVKQNAPTQPKPLVIKTMNVTLAKRPTSQTIPLNWNTTGLDTQFSYTINATVIIDLDEDLSDNIMTKKIALQLGHDVEVTTLTATPKVFVGETVTISVTVTNVGGFNETLFEVKISYGTNLIGSQQVPSLSVRDSKTLSFTWDTAGVTPARYEVKAEAILEGDRNPADNKIIVLVDVKTPVGHIAGIVKDASTGNPIEGANVTANGYRGITDANGYYNITNILVGTYTVTASADGYYVSSQTGVNVVAGQSTTLNLNLTSLPAYIDGTVIDSSSENPIEGAEVTINGHSVSTDAEGYYKIELTPGTYNVTVSAGGYESSTETNVNVVAGQTTTVNFRLLPIQQSNITLYVVMAVVGIIIIAGIALYLRKAR